MYHGEVNVAEDSLNVFLAVAEELAIKGLATNVSSRFDGSSTASAPAEIFSASYDEQIKQAFLTGKNNLGKSTKIGKKRSAPLSDSEGGVKHLKSEPTDGSEDETSDVFQAADDNDFSYEDGGFNVIRGGKIVIVIIKLFRTQHNPEIYKVVI